MPPRVGVRVSDNLLRSSGYYNFPASFPSFRSKINYIISAFNNIKVMLNNYN